MRNRMTFLVAVCALGTLVTLGCGLRETNITTGKGGEKKLVLTGPRPTSLEPGETEQIKIMIERKGFSGEVQLEFADLPPGVEIVGGNQQTFEAAADEKSFQIKAAKGAKSVANNVRVTATAKGITPNTVDFMVTVGGEADGKDAKGGKVDRATLEKRRKELSANWKQTTDRILKTMKDVREWTKESSVEVRQSVETVLKKIEQQRDIVDKEADLIGGQTEDTWNDFERRFNAAMSELLDGVNDAVDQFQKEKRNKKDKS
jgi:hypothetical protein